MMQDMESAQLSNRLKLYMIQSDKFKTDLIGIYIKRRLTKEEAGLNALLSRILIRGTETFDTTKKLNIHLESCYGMILVSDVVKYGDHHILQLKLQFPDAKHILDKNIFEDALELLHEILFHPLIEEGRFNQAVFNQEKNHLIDEINSRVNDKMSYSIERCIECMYEDEDYETYVYGDIENIELITNEMLYEHYLKVIAESQVDVSVMGDLTFEVVKKSVKEKLYFDDFSVVSNSFETHQIKDTKVIHEEFNVKQGKLVLGYDTQILNTDPLYEASVLAYHIMGGGPNSQLFKLLREDKSLCYYVFSKSDKFKGCMFLGVGIESENYDLVLELIDNTLKSLIAGEVSEEELRLAKEAMVASIRSLSDYPNSFINFFYTEILDQPLSYEFSIEKMIEAYKEVTIEDLIKVYKNLVLDTVYFIDGGAN